MYGSGPTGGYYSDGYAGGSPMMVDDGEVVESDGATPPAPQAAPAQMQPQQQPTPAAQRRPVRRTSNMRQRPPMQRQYYQAANQNYQAANQNGPANHYPDQYQQ